MHKSIDTFGAAFGRLIKRRRAEANMTQGRLACALYPNLDPEEAEKRKGDISKLENGRVHNPTAQTIKALSDALKISEDEIDALQRRMQMSAGEQLEHIPVLDRDALELLAARFDIAGVHSMSEKALQAELTKRAEDYRRLRTEVDEINPRYVTLSNLKAAAQDAIARVDLDDVEHLLSQVQATELDEAARSAELRADNLLLRGELETAFRVLNSAANSFEAVDPSEPTRRRLRYEDRFYAHGLRYGGSGLALSEKMIRSALTIDLEASEPSLWAKGQSALAITLQEQGTRTQGPDGASLLGEAVESYRAALRVRTEADHPVDWATTMQNLAIALANQGTRTQGPEGAALLGEAVDICRAALRVFTEADHPVQWAMTKQNLAVVLKEQGTRTEGPEGAALLSEAVHSYSAALRVSTAADHPVQWAMTMQNLALALKEQGTRTQAPEGAALLGEAVESYRAALRVFTKADYPVQWAMTQENMAFTEEARSQHDTTADPRPHLEAALVHVANALRVYDADHMSYYHTKATALRNTLQTALNALPSSSS